MMGCPICDQSQQAGHCHPLLLGLERADCSEGAHGYCVLVIVLTLCLFLISIGNK